jgi:hypothetical protein
MSPPCTVIIGAIELLETLRECSAENTEILEFGDHEPLKALDAITTRRPKVIAVERLFAATSRGAALINRVKADPDLADAEIRVVSVDGTYRVSPRRKSVRPASTSRAPAPSRVDEVNVRIEPDEADADTTPAESPAAAQNLDYRGTRRVPRFRLVEDTEVQVDGALAKIVDLSTRGAQILCAAPLKPQQKVRMVLADNLGNVKFSGTIVWASFEIPKGVSRYRAGVEFNDAEPKAVAAFCKRHKL